MLIVSAKQAILPGHADPVAATLEISSEAGKIIQIYEAAKTRQDYSNVDDNHFIQLEDDQILLPGLVDAVCQRRLITPGLSLLANFRH